MKKILIAALLLFGFASPAMADQCSGWISKAYPVKMEACSYTSGGSGYYKITNTGTKTAEVCWAVVSSSGKQDSGCNSKLDPGQSTSGSCYQCGSKNGGAREIILRSYKVAGEKSPPSVSQGKPSNQGPASGAANPNRSASNQNAASPVGQWQVRLVDTGDKTSMVLNADGTGRIAGEYPSRWTRRGNHITVKAYGSEENLRRNDDAQIYELDFVGADMTGTQLPLRVGNKTFSGHPIAVTRQ